MAALHSVRLALKLTLALIHATSLNGWHSKVRCTPMGCRTRIDLQWQSPGCYVDRRALPVRSVIVRQDGKYSARWTFRPRELCAA